MSDVIYVTKSKERITDISSSTGLTAANYQAEGVVYALIQVTGNALRYWTDGNDPTTSEGHYLAVYGAVEVWGLRDMSNFRGIEAAATGYLEVTYFGTGG